MVFHTMADIEHHLNGLGLFHMDMALTRIIRVTEALGVRSVSCPVVQVLGTNGKGSTATFLAHFFAAQGLAVGLYTSPHFCSPTERIKAPHVEANDWVVAANAIAQVSLDLTYFEFLTVLAMVVFTKRCVDVIVLEAGLGGAHDATTAIRRSYCALGPIALDHTNVLGAALRAIAEDKVMAIEPGMHVASVQQYPVVREVLFARIRQTRASLTMAASLPACYRHAVRLLGAHQYSNAGLAFSLWQTISRDHGFPMEEAGIEEALSKANLPGRLQCIPAGDHYPKLCVDGAHNPHAMQTMLSSLKALALQPRALVFSALADKDWRSVVRILKQGFPDLPAYFPQMSNARAENANVLAQAWYGETLPPSCARLLGKPVGALLEELKPAVGDGFVLVTGSLYLLAELFTVVPMQDS